MVEVESVDSYSGTKYDQSRFEEAWSFEQIAVAGLELSERKLKLGLEWET